MHADRDGSEPPTVIVPTGHCGRPWVHDRHLFGPNENARLCDGQPIQQEAN